MKVNWLFHWRHVHSNTCNQIQSSATQTQRVHENTVHTNRVCCRDKLDTNTATYTHRRRHEQHDEYTALAAVNGKRFGGRRDGLDLDWYHVVQVMVVVVAVGKRAIRTAVQRRRV